MRKLILGVLAALAVTAGVARSETVWPIISDIYHRSYNNTYLDTIATQYFGVWPVAWGHTAGTVYTVDGWQTVKWANAGWLANVTNQHGGYDENWQVQMTGRNSSAGYGQITFEYALYVKNAQGQWFWNNNGGMNFKNTHRPYYR